MALIASRLHWIWIGTVLATMHRVKGVVDAENDFRRHIGKRSAN